MQASRSCSSCICLCGRHAVVAGCYSIVVVILFIIIAWRGPATCRTSRRGAPIVKYAISNSESEIRTSGSVVTEIVCRPSMHNTIVHMPVHLTVNCIGPITRDGNIIIIRIQRRETVSFNMACPFTRETRLAAKMRRRFVEVWIAIIFAKHGSATMGPTIRTYSRSNDA